MRNTVADNQTYKNQYHFTDDFKDTAKENPSIEGKPKINTTIKENPYRSNVEIEGGEIVLQPDLSALFKAQGKRHSKGGMDVLLRPDSFIFSDFKDLAITEDEKEKFELKKGGSSSPQKNTPAEVLKKNVDVKHYNTLIDNITNPFKDDLARKSSAMMLEKYINTLGNIAFIQEKKKDFPDGLPSFSVGTAPVYDTDTKDTIDASKQYMKAGGAVGNPKMQRAGSFNPYNRGVKGYLVDEAPYKVPPIIPNDAVVLPLLKKMEELLRYHNSSAIKSIDSPEYKKSMQEMSKVSLLLRKYGVDSDWTDTEAVNDYRQKLVPYNFGNGDYGNGKDVNDYFASSEYYKPQSNNVSPSQTPSIPTQTSIPTTKPTFSQIINTNPRQDRYIGRRPPYPDQWTNYMDKTQGKQYNAPNWINPNTFYGTPGLIDYMKTLDKQKGVDWDMNKADDGVWGWRHQAALEKFFPNGNRPSAVPVKLDIDLKRANQLVGNGIPKVDGIPPRVDGPIPNDVTGDSQYGKTVDWKFTPWQKVSQAYNWGQYAGASRYMPYRSRYDATYADPRLLNPEQTVGDIKGQVNQQISSLRSLNPILRNAQATSSFGMAMNQIPGIRSQYDNQNAQISNQFRQYNNQVRNNESMVNMQNDQTYYQQAVEGRKNFNNLRTFTANNAMSNVLGDVQTNQKLAYNLLTQNNPAYSFDWTSGNFIRNKKDIRDSLSSNSSDFYNDFLKELDSAKTPEDLEKLKIKERLMRQKNILPYLQQSSNGSMFGKKGGKVKNPYK